MRSAAITGIGEIYAQDAGDFSSSHDSKNRGQGMQFHTVAHDARGGNIILDQSPGAKKNQQNYPVGVAEY